MQYNGAVTVTFEFQCSVETETFDEAYEFLHMPLDIIQSKAFQEFILAKYPNVRVKHVILQTYDINDLHEVA